MITSSLTLTLKHGHVLLTSKCTPLTSEVITLLTNKNYQNVEEDCLHIHRCTQA